MKHAIPRETHHYGRRLISLLLAVMLVVSLCVTGVSSFSADTTTADDVEDAALTSALENEIVLGFSSDVHGNVGTYTQSGGTYTAGSNTGLANWLIRVQAQTGAFEYMSYCGDYGDHQKYGSNYISDFNAVVSATNTLVGQNKGVYTTGNHDYQSGSNNNSIASDLSGTTGYKRIGEAVKTNDYIIYVFGAASGSQQFNTNDINELSNYLASAPTDIPIFVLSHFPLHSISGRTSSNAGDVIDALNQRSNVIFMWGHNHSQVKNGTETNYGKVYTAGYSLTYNTNQSKTINFTYANAGGMRDVGSSQPDNNEYKGVVATVSKSDHSVKFRYYRSENGEAIGDTYTVTVNGGGSVQPATTAPVESGTYYKRVSSITMGSEYVVVAPNTSSSAGFYALQNPGATDSGIMNTAASITNNTGDIDGDGQSDNYFKSADVDSSLVWKVVNNGSGFDLVSSKDNGYLECDPKSGSSSSYDTKVYTNGKQDSSRYWTYTSGSNLLEYVYSSGVKPTVYYSTSYNYFKGTTNTSGTSSDKNVYFYEKIVVNGGSQPATQAPATQAPATQAPATQAPATTAPVTTGTYYKQVDDITVGKEYVVVAPNGSSSGRFFALQNPGAADAGVMNATTSISGSTGDIDNDGKSDTYFKDVDSSIVWKVVKNGSGFDLVSAKDNGYLECDPKSGSSSSYDTKVYTNGKQNSSRYWTYTASSDLLEYVYSSGVKPTVYYSTSYNYFKGTTNSSGTSSDKTVLFFEKVEGTQPATQAPATQAPATQAPATQAPATQAPATQAPATQAPATQAPATTAPAAGDTYYKLVSSMTAGKEYVIASKNAAGSAYAVQNAGASASGKDVAAATVTVVSGTLSGASATYIANPDASLVWKTTANGSGFNLTNNGGILECEKNPDSSSGNSYNVLVYTATQDSGRYWTYTSNDNALNFRFSSSASPSLYYSDSNSKFKAHTGSTTSAKVAYLYEKVENGSQPATQAPATQAPATQAPATQAPATQAPTQAPGKTPINPVVTLQDWTYGEKANTPVVQGNPGNAAVTFTYAALTDYINSTFDPGINLDTIFSATVPTNAGSYVVRAVVAESPNYLGGTAFNSFMIEKAESYLEVDITGWSYGSAPNAPVVKYADPASPVVTYYYKVQGAADSTYTTAVPTKGGTYVLKGVVAATDNYLGVEDTAVFMITKVAGAISVSMNDWTYGETAAQPKATIWAGDTGATITYTYAAEGSTQFTAKKPADAGKYVVKAVMAETNSSYAAEATDTFTIEKADLVVTAKNQTVNYGAVIDQTAYTARGLVAGDKITVKLAGSIVYNTITPYVYDADNYNVTVVKGLLGIVGTPNTWAFPKGKTVITKWYNIASADGYFVYAAYRGDSDYEIVADLPQGSIEYTISKLHGKALDTKKNILLFVAAYQNINGKKVKLIRSSTVHIAGANSATYTNAANLTVPTKTLTLKVGQTYTIKPTVTKADKTKILPNYTPTVRYATSHSAIAPVNGNGKITAVAKGVANVYAYTSNGTRVIIKVTVE